MKSASSLAVMRHDLAIAAPWGREAAALEALLEDAKACAVPQQHLASFAALVDEQEQVARERIATASSIEMSGTR